jgi:hypothetical protein
MNTMAGAVKGIRRRSRSRYLVGDLVCLLFTGPARRAAQSSHPTSPVLAGHQAAQASEPADLLTLKPRSTAFFGSIVGTGTRGRGRGLLPSS